MRLLITAGPTREPIDAVRFISNRSSGRLGVALAQAAVQAGHEVTLLLGPVCVEPPAVRVERFESTADLQALLERCFPPCDALVMAAAVGDYRLAQSSQGKLARQEAGTLTLELTPTPDLVAGLAQCRRPEQRIVAFALESPEVLEARAAAKLRRKGVDAIVANPLQTMEADAIDPRWITASGQTVRPGLMPKTQFAPWLLTQVQALFV